MQRHNTRIWSRRGVWGGGSALVVLALTACGGGSTGDTSGAAATPTPTTSGAACTAAVPAGFRVVGYLPSWQGNVAEVAFARLRHVCYAFALPTAAGGLRPLEDPAKLQALVAQAHQRGVRVSIAVGGWNGGDDSAFTTLAGTAAGRAAFAQALAGLVAEQGLDGVDIDWEYPDVGDRANFTALVHELSVLLRPSGKLVSAAVSAGSTGSAGVGSEAFAELDWVGAMAYDGDNGAGHSPYSLASSAVDYWLGRGVPRDKLVLGVPFYSRPGGRSYASLVGSSADAPNHDVLGGEYYNGVDTIKRKACLALERAGGVMVWELSQDTHDQTSLLAAIGSVVGR